MPLCYQVFSFISSDSVWFWNRDTKTWIFLVKKQTSFVNRPNVEKVLFMDPMCHQQFTFKFYNILDGAVWLYKEETTKRIFVGETNMRDQKEGFKFWNTSLGNERSSTVEFVKELDANCPWVSTRCCVVSCCYHLYDEVFLNNEFVSCSVVMMRIIFFSTMTMTWCHNLLWHSDGVIGNKM